MYINFFFLNRRRKASIKLFLWDNDVSGHVFCFAFCRQEWIKTCYIFILPLSHSFFSFCLHTTVLSLVHSPFSLLLLSPLLIVFYFFIKTKLICSSSLCCIPNTSHFSSSSPYFPSSTLFHILSFLSFHSPLTFHPPLISSLYSPLIFHPLLVSPVPPPFPSRSRSVPAGWQTLRARNRFFIISMIEFSISGQKFLSPECECAGGGQTGWLAGWLHPLPYSPLSHLCFIAASCINPNDGSFGWMLRSIHITRM